MVISYLQGLDPKIQMTTDGQCYLFYHNADLFLSRTPQNSPDIKKKGYRRSICVEKLFYNADGTIQKVIPTKE